MTLIEPSLRRARASGMSLIPTSTGSATAIAEIFPELRGRLNGHAVRVPLANASLTDCVFEVERATTVEEVNQFLKDASENELKDMTIDLPPGMIGNPYAVAMCDEAAPSIQDPEEIERIVSIAERGARVVLAALAAWTAVRLSADVRRLYRRG